MRTGSLYSYHVRGDGIHEELDERRVVLRRKDALLGEPRAHSDRPQLFLTDSTRKNSSQTQHTVNRKGAELVQLRLL
jgi:hypothetical protein